MIYLIFLQEVADHAHPAAVWYSMEQLLIDGTVDQKVESKVPLIVIVAP